MFIIFLIVKTIKRRLKKLNPRLPLINYLKIVVLHGIETYHLWDFASKHLLFFFGVNSADLSLFKMEKAPSLYTLFCKVSDVWYNHKSFNGDS